MTMIYFMCKDSYGIYVADMILWFISIMLFWWWGYRLGKKDEQ